MTGQDGGPGPDRGAGAGPDRRPTAPTDSRPTVPFTLDDDLAGRFADLAGTRVLVVDYLVTRRPPQIALGELSARLQRTPPPGTVTVGTIEGVPCYAEPALAGVLREARPRLRPVAGGVLGQLAIELERPLPFIDYLSSVAPNRS
jgi:hypothetical protein